MTDIEHRDFFVSYTAADTAWAEWLAWQLEENGYRVTIQAWDFAAGSNWVQDMDRGLAEAERMIAVLSPAYLRSEPAKAEWSAAFAEDPLGTARRLIPVRIQDCDLAPLAKTIVYIDMVGASEAEATRRLLDGVRGARRPSEAPGFPGRERLEALSAPRFPGGLPPIWNLPARNAHFAGRDDVLADLEARISAGGTQVVTQALAGLGGIGKSTVVLEYAYRNIGGLDLGWWINADEPATLLEQFAALTGPLALPTGDGDLDLACSIVRRWLEDHDGWLVVFDNAEDPSLLRDLLPRSGQGRVLITSRRQDWSGISATSTVASLPHDVAARFLMDRSGDHDEVAALAIANELGGLPLALEQAGAYVAHTPTATLATYLELFRHHSTRVFERGQPLDYPDTVLTTWSLALDRIGTEHPPALELLRLLAFLAPDDVPVSLLMDTTDALPPALRTLTRDTWAFEAALTALTRYSLVGGSADALSIHRLVQAVTRDQLTSEGRDLADVAVHLILAAFPDTGGEVSAWPQCLRLYPHALAALELGTRHGGMNSHEAAVLLRRMAAFQQSRGNYEIAREHLLVALHHHESLVEPDLPEMLITLGGFASVLFHQGDFPAARELQQHVFDARKRILGRDHHHTLTAAINLASTLQEQGELPAARELEEDVLEARKRALGDDHPSTLNAANNLAETLRALGDFPAARELQQSVLDAARRTLAQDHPYTLTAANNLAETLRAQGDFPAARELQQHVLSARKRVFGEAHPSTVIAASNLAATLWAQGELPAARELEEEVLEARKRIFGEDHPSTLTAASNLAGTLRAQGELPAARELEQHVVDARKRILGEDHPSTLTAASNLAATLWAQGELPAARELQQQVLNTARRVLGEDHPATLTATSNLAASLEAQGEFPAARELQQHVVDARRRILGEDHPDTLTAANNLTVMLRA